MCANERIITNSKVLYKELYKKAKSKIHTEKYVVMKRYNDKNQTWQAPFFILLDELEESHLSPQEKLGVLAHLKAHIARKMAENNWQWQILGVATALAALFVSIVASGDNFDSYEIIPSIFAFIAVLVAIMGGFVRPKQCSIDQYVLSIVESVESYYLNQISDHQAIKTKKLNSTFVAHMDKT